MTGRDRAIGLSRHTRRDPLFPHAKDSRAVALKPSNKSAVSQETKDLRDDGPLAKRAFKAPTIFKEEVNDAPARPAFKAPIASISPIKRVEQVQGPKKAGFRSLPVDSDDSEGDQASSQPRKSFRKIDASKSSSTPTKDSKTAGGTVSDDDEKLFRPPPMLDDSPMGKTRGGDIPRKFGVGVSNKKATINGVTKSNQDKCLRTNLRSKGVQHGNPSSVDSSPDPLLSAGGLQLIDSSDMAGSPQSSQYGSHLGHSQFLGSSQVRAKRKATFGKNKVPRPPRSSNNTQVSTKSADNSDVDDISSTPPKLLQAQSTEEETQRPKKFKIFHHPDITDDQDSIDNSLVARDVPKPILSSLDSSMPFTSSDFIELSGSQSSISNFTGSATRTIRLLPLASMEVISLDDASQEGVHDPMGSPLPMNSDINIEDTAISPNPKCPICGENVTQQLVDAYSTNWQQMRMSEQVAFCRYHKRQTAIASYDAATYPTIDWSSLDERVTKHHKLILSILDGSHESYYRNVLSEAIQSGKSSRTLRQEIEKGKGADETAQSTTPGYYGSRGLRVISDNLVAQFSSKLRRLAVKDKLILAAGGVGSYVHRVLVPEIAVRLIAEDMDIDVEQARIVMRDSIAIGETLNEEVNETITRKSEDIGDDYSQC